jgi:hypothetical protein
VSTATAVRATHNAAQGEGLFGIEEPPSALQLVEPETEGELEAVPVGETVPLVDEQGAISASFNELAEELEEMTAGLSSMRRAVRYPAFIEILALGDSAIPAVIERLKTTENRPLWLRVLGTLTPFPPGAGESTIDDAAAAWIRWGRLAR